MPHYIVDRNAQANGDHEVHLSGSVWSCLPAEADQRELGSHDGCASALRIARLFYGKANGCARCAVSCHVPSDSVSSLAAPGAAVGSA